VCEGSLGVGGAGGGWSGESAVRGGGRLIGKGGRAAVINRGDLERGRGGGGWCGQ